MQIDRIIGNFIIIIIIIIIFFLNINNKYGNLYYIDQIYSNCNEYSLTSLHYSLLKPSINFVMQLISI